MKLEVGKYYANKFKNKAQIVFYDPLLNKYMAVFMCKRGGCNYTSWFSDAGINEKPCDHDLISEWVEPVEHEVDVWAMKRHDNSIYFFDGETT